MNFDSFAASYDATFGLRPVGRLFRFRVAERVLSEVPGGARILDIGCGTGEDAVWLAARGYAVHGIDESPRMIEAARAKAVRWGSSATFECRPLQSMAGEPARFEAVLSNFGALNCVPTATWAEIVLSLLTASGRAFVVLMGGRPLPEGVRSGFPGTDRGPVAEVRVGESCVTVRYESIAAVKRALQPSATLTRVEALGCLLPGPGYEGFTRRHPILLDLLAMGECVVRQTWFFRGRGDHTLFEFSRR